jgi:hypothetical protein
VGELGRGTHRPLQSELVGGTSRVCLVPPAPRDGGGLYAILFNSAQGWGRPSAAVLRTPKRRFNPPPRAGEYADVTSHDSTMPSLH